MVKMVKREPDGSNYSKVPSQVPGSTTKSASATVNNPRILRSLYRNVKTFIHDEREDITQLDSDKFDLIFSEIESLHQQVRKPREQVADAEALLEITNTLMSSVKALNSGGPTPSEFISCILKQFGEQGGLSRRNSIFWKDIGVEVSQVFKGVPGCRTMIGPLDSKFKRRRVAIHRRHERPMDIAARPKELDSGSKEDRTDTDKNMLTMFNILRRHRVVKLENLVLNRNSFAQTVENLFALSFLVKDGRAEIKVNHGCQLVSPRNAPAANAILSKEVTYSHFMFRVDYKDWKLMARSVGDGEELMPHRNSQTKDSNVCRIS